MSLVRGVVAALNRAASRFQFLALRLRFAASAFAVILLFEFANTFHVAVRPNASVQATIADSARLSNLATEKPSLQRDLVDSHHSSDLGRGIVFHYATTNSIFKWPLSSKVHRRWNTLGRGESMSPNLWQARP